MSGSDRTMSNGPAGARGPRARDRMSPLRGVAAGQSRCERMELAAGFGTAGECIPADWIGKAAAGLLHLKALRRRRNRGNGAMKAFRLAIAAALLIASAGIACAQTTLRIGLAEDPDILD